jgi:hypothetical protein
VQVGNELIKKLDAALLQPLKRRHRRERRGKRKQQQCKYDAYGRSHVVPLLQRARNL